MNKKYFLYGLGRFISWLIAKWFRTRLLVHKESFGTKGAIIAPNHTSYLDPPFIAAMMPMRAYFLAKSSLFKVPLFGKILYKINVLPITRGGADLKSIKKISQFLIKGSKVVIFPEGTRSQDGLIQRFRQGIALIAFKSAVPIIPMYIHGTYDIWSRKRRFPILWGKVTMIMGKPISPKHYMHLNSKDGQSALIKEVERQVKGLKDWYEEGAKGTVPSI